MLGNQPLKNSKSPAAEFQSIGYFYRHENILMIGCLCTFVV